MGWMRGRMPEWVERANRSPVQIAAALHLTGRELPVTIIDMSEEGCKIRCLQILPIGQVVQLHITAFQPNVATVRWSLPGVAGLKFI
jgi:hypothetical protein